MLNQEATTESTPNQEQQVGVLALTDAAAAQGARTRSGRAVRSERTPNQDTFTGPGEAR